MFVLDGYWISDYSRIQVDGRRESSIKKWVNLIPFFSAFGA
jgi:hypothetical protein